MRRVLIAAAVVIALAGCSGGSDDPPTAGEASAETAASAAGVETVPSDQAAANRGAFVTAVRATGVAVPDGWTDDQIGDAAKFAADLILTEQGPEGITIGQLFQITVTVADEYSIPMSTASELVGAVGGYLDAMS